MTKSSPDPYASAWEKIDSLVTQRLPASALQEVEQLLVRAREDKYSSEILKCLIYRSGLANESKENGLVAAIDNLNQELATAQFPEAPVLKSLLAELYDIYLNNNRWQIGQRTALAEGPGEDLQTWTTRDFVEKSQALYLASLRTGTQLSNIDLKDYSAILIKGNQQEGLRPTLYDFLAHRAIDFFSNDRNVLPDPIQPFVMNQAAFFADAATFSQLLIESPDPKAIHFHSLKIYQNLIQTHLSDADPRALIDIELKRLKFVFEQSSMAGKEKAYVEALENLRDKYQNEAVYTEISYQLATYYRQKGNRYQTGQQTERWTWKTADEICQLAIDRFPDSYGARQCQRLQSQLREKNMGLQMEQVQLPNEPILLSLNYRNLKQLKFKVLAWDDDRQSEFNNLDQPQSLSWLNSLAVLQEWTQTLPDAGDFREHRVELKVDALPFGSYLVLAVDEQSLTDTSYAFAQCRFQVSNLAYWKEQSRDGASAFYVVDRKGGQALADVEVRLYRQQYNNRRRKYEYNLLGTQKTNENGKIITRMKERGGFQIELRKGEDRLRLDENHYINWREREDITYDRTHFFLDRAIYRPGQTVYFKAIAIQASGESSRPTILANKPITVTLFDVNNQEITKVDGITNAYGAFSGTFETPKTGLLGNMSLRSSLGNDSQYFRVEEYKRPKFEVNFLPVADNYRLNDSIKAVGKAVAYAGNSIGDAQVRYRVVRKVRYPYWPMWRGGTFFPQPQSNAQEIANGATQTDEQGRFEIPFLATPDLNADPKTQPVFRYEITADVIDITGETHTASQTVSVGYVALDIQVKLPNLVNADSLKTLSLVVNNLDGQAQAATGEITIHRLDAPTEPLRPRELAQPDTFVLDRATFKRFFPLDPYQQEDQMGSWPVGQRVWTTNFSTQTTQELAIPSSQLSSGYYEIEMKTTDRYGEAISWKKRFTVYDLDEQQLPSQALFFYVNEQGNLEPGQTASSYFGSAFADAQLFYQIEKEGKVITQKWVKASGLENLTLPITAAHRGHLHYQLVFVRHNRFFSRNGIIRVPWTNKKLHFSYETFRDKLAPGQQEEWRIRVSGAAKEKVAAEMLVAMYDASLDAFAPNQWNWNLWQNSGRQLFVRSDGFRARYGQLFTDEWNRYESVTNRVYQRLNLRPMQNVLYGQARVRAMATRQFSVAGAIDPNEKAEAVDLAAAPEQEVLADLPTKNVEAIAAKPAGLSSTDESIETVDPAPPAVRTNLKETVFFLPDLKTDENGDVLISFKMNEALTRWKFLGMAHTRDLKSAFTEKEIITQKELMIQPNAPRFFREEDKITFTAKVSNLSTEALSGMAELQLFDALTNEPVHQLLGNPTLEKSFTVEKGQSTRVAWTLQIPVGKVAALTHRVIARAGNKSDGEESTTPVVSNRMLVTETLPLPVRGKTEKTFDFAAMQKATTSSTLQHHRYTLEFTSNPAWYAVQALPYMMEYPYDCTEQIFNRYYANALATSIANAHPKVKQVFDQWKDTKALVSNLEKNQELKSALLEETPWVLAAQSEAEQKRNIGLLFDLDRMADEQESALNKLAERQLPNGGFAWFPGGRDNWYITQYLVEGIGHLQALGVQLDGVATTALVKDNAIRYIDDRLVEHFDKLKKRIKASKGDLNADHLDVMAIHYLYSRSFFLDIEPSEATQKAIDFYLQQAEKYWTKQSIYSQGMIGLALHRFERESVPDQIIRSLNERAVRHDELGMYWVLPSGYYWYHHPIETQALLIELYEEVAEDAQGVEEMKIWLLKNKQTTHWKTTKATANAVYALLRTGTNWLLEDQPVTISVGEQEVKVKAEEREAGTGYFKTHWNGESISKDMAKITINNPNSTVAWGGVYWQYFEQLDKITQFEETPLTIRKALFREENTNSGPVLTAVDEQLSLQAGDRLKVRIELRVDRDMEYVHMKDMRAAGFEPINVLSQYKWQDGLGYYESTKDLATHFFFSYLPKGTYVFEYPLRVVHQGDFSNGVTTVQCMYAPEFTSHSEGIRVRVE